MSYAIPGVNSAMLQPMHLPEKLQRSTVIKDHTPSEERAYYRAHQPPITLNASSIEAMSDGNNAHNQGEGDGIFETPKNIRFR